MEEVVEETKLNLIISNKYFDLLFQLLNLGIEAISTSSWNLLTQVPVNNSLLSKIHTLNLIDPITGIPDWNTVLDSRNTYKLLYSL